MDPSPTRSGLRTFTVVVAALFALVLLVGGVWLAALGGSYYYAITGIVLLVVAVLLRKRSSGALWLYAILMLATLVWSLWESGTDFWALVPRLDILGLLGIWLLIPAVTRGIGEGLKAGKSVLSVTLALAIAVLVYSIFNDPQEIEGSLASTQPEQAQPIPGIDPADWPAYGRTQNGTRYSPLAQINDGNVKDLEVAWTFRSGQFKRDQDSGETTNELTPIKIGDNMYICTTHHTLVALNPATGEEKWRFDPDLDSRPSYQHLTCRGVTYYDQTNTEEFAASLANQSAPVQTSCPRKVFLPTGDARLYAINADTGERCADFAENGELDLKKMQPYAYPGGLQPTSPPVVSGTTLIIGGSVTDNYSVHEPSGAIRGYDVNTGELRWIFDTGAEDPNAIPDGGEKLVNNSPNAWAPLAYDAKADVVFVPTGVATPDIWGGHRTENMERYASAVLALNGSTGKLLWSYQTTRHDLWDMDVPSQPTLADVKSESGEMVPAVYVPTKAGNLFVLDRRDGRPIVPISEIKVPQGAAEGDWVAETQPRSALNLTSIQTLSDKNMWGATMFDQMVCRVIFKQLRYEGQYTPPSEQGTIVFPGNLGVFEWGGISVNPDRQIAVMNPMALPFTSKLIPRGPGNPMWPENDEQHGSGTEAGVQPQYGVPYGVELNPFLSPFGLPCKEPAWGYITGVDMKTHEVVWRKRIGTIRDSLPPLQLPPLKIGVPMLGGPISTAGNVMFIAGTQDNYLRAFNVTNGEKLWEARLPAGGQATPMTYEANGKQYVVIMAGGHGSFGTKMGDYLIAYALPDKAE